MAVLILREDARKLPLADDSVDLIVTSPPYLGQRSYRDGGEHYDGQIGAEATPSEYIDNLIDCTREWVRVLKPDGSMFVNLADKYVTDKRRSDGTAARQKSLLGLPSRYAIRCMDDLGLILRRDIVWSKVNPLPESVTDRCRSSHEYLFHLVRQPCYYAAVDYIRQEHQHPRRDNWDRREDKVNGIRLSQVDARMGNNPLGALPSSVWEIASEPLRVPDHIAHRRCCGGRKREGCKDELAHHAAFPTELPRRIVLGWSPTGICTTCGEGRRPVTGKTRQVDRYHRQQNLGKTYTPGLRHEGEATSTLHMETVTAITGEVCGCPDTSAPTRPAVVVDPFGGTGTTALVADVHGRDGVSVDLSADYGYLAEWRTSDPKQREKAARPCRWRGIEAAAPETAPTELTTEGAA